MYRNSYYSFSVCFVVSVVSVRSEGDTRLFSRGEGKVLGLESYYFIGKKSKK